VPKQRCIPLLKALADETRWQLVRELLSQPRTVGELVERLGVSQYNVSKHLRTLREAGLVEARREGKHVHCHVADDFRRQLKRNATVLDLGCCTFRFE
jgi:DNA-binding transcriptional ArsR family regulator